MKYEYRRFYNVDTEKVRKQVVMIKMKSNDITKYQQQFGEIM